EGELRRPPVAEHGAGGDPTGSGQLDAGAGHACGGVVDQPGEMAESGSGRPEALRGLGERRRGDAAERELVEHCLQGGQEARGPGLRAKRAGADGIEGRGEEAVEGGAAAGPESRWADDRVAQPLEGPALVFSRALHGGPATLRPGDDTAPATSSASSPGERAASIEGHRRCPSKVPDTFDRASQTTGLR